MNTDRGTFFVMGVSGVGKTTVGSALAEALGLDFIDADDLHPAENKAKMGAGIPLTDEDRWPWLEAVGLAAADRPAVVACSALRRGYREHLLALVPDGVFVHLDADRDDIAHRIAARDHEYMPAGLLDSQLATLEPLESDEPGLRVDATLPLEDLVRVGVESYVTFAKQGLVAASASGTASSRRKSADRGA